MQAGVVLSVSMPSSFSGVALQMTDVSRRVWVRGARASKRNKYYYYVPCQVLRQNVTSFSLPFFCPSEFTSTILPKAKANPQFSYVLLVDCTNIRST